MSGKKYGYARVSTDDQSLDIQREKLSSFGCDVILEEKRSGGSMDGRAELQLLLKVIGAGDVLVVTKTDRLGRDILDQATIAKEIEKRGAGILALDEAIDTRSEGGRLYFHLMSVFADQERRRIRARQREGIDKAKSRGVYRGRPPSIDAGKVHEMRRQGIGPAEIARTLECSESSVFRIINANGHDIETM